MAQIKANMVDSYLTRPNPVHRIILIFGQDIGLVIERADKLAESYLQKSDDPFSLVRLESPEIAADPLRLADEANTISMFGGNRVIIIQMSGNKSIQPALNPLLSTPPKDAYVIIKAGDLNKSSSLRKTIESSPHAVALPCYMDTREALNTIMDEELAIANLSISREARLLLLENLGADRMASRREIQKLCLYALGKGAVSEQDIEDIVGDASNQQVDFVIDAAALGKTGDLDRRLEQSLGAGQQASVIGSAALRHFQMLERCLHIMDKGGSAQSALEKVAPRLHFKRKPQVQAQLRLWSTKNAARACELLAQSIANSRKHYHLSNTVISETLLMIAATANRSGR